MQNRFQMAGIFNGMLGTKRFCSSRDWGNYCEYIERPGDIQEYRSCVFTCSINSCNDARTVTANRVVTVSMMTLVSVMIKLL
jgi:hypothetical protein